MLTVKTDVNFCPDPSRIVLWPDKRIEYFLSDRCSLIFSNFQFITPEGRVSAENLIERIVPAKTVLERHKDFKLNKSLKSFFHGRSKTVFLDESQIKRLDELFQNFACDGYIDILVDGVESTVNNIPPSMKRDIMTILDDMDVVATMSPIDFAAVSEIKKYKKVAKRSEFRREGKGVRKSKKKLDLFVGGVMMAIGGVVAVIGATLAKSAFESISGITEEVIIVEDDLGK